MGWFGFGGARARDEYPRADARHNKMRVYEAVRIDRAGKPSRLPDDLPRRRDYQERWDRR